MSNHYDIEKEHPDITYLKQDGIGLVLSRGLMQTYLSKPSNPVEFFSKLLLNHSKTQKRANAVRFNHDDYDDN